MSPAKLALILSLLAWQLLAASQPSRAQEPAGPAAVTVPVFYATDREPLESSPFGYANSRTTSYWPVLDYGICQVTLPLTAPERQELEQAGPTELEALGWKEADAVKAPQIAIERISSEGKDHAAVFLDRLAAAAPHQVVVYIHGYNTTFDKAAQAAAHLSLHLQKPVVLFSWPSHGGILAPRKTPFLAKLGCGLCLTYAWDLTSIFWSTPHFEYFLGQLINALGPSHISLVAHSMGNQLLYNALVARTAQIASAFEPEDEFDWYADANQPRIIRFLEQDKHLPAEAVSKLSARERADLCWMIQDLDKYKELPQFKAVVLLAPDIDMDVFQYSFTSFLANAEDTYIFMNERDKALRLSQRLTNSQRLGLQFLPHAEELLPNLHVIDFSNVALGKVHHSVSWDIVADILERGTAPAGYGLKEIARGAYRYLKVVFESAEALARPGGKDTPVKR